MCVGGWGRGGRGRRASGDITTDSPDAELDFEEVAEQGKDVWG